MLKTQVSGLWQCAMSAGVLCASACTVVNTNVNADDPRGGDGGPVQGMLDANVPPPESGSSTTEAGPIGLDASGWDAAPTLDADMRDTGLGDASRDAQPGDAHVANDATDTETPDGSTASDSACDMNGVWIARQLTRSQALGQGQVTNSWYYLELKHHGTSITVVRHFDCGIETRGSITTILSSATRAALSTHNIQTGRAGSMERMDNTCSFTMERFWSVRGATEATFVPSPRNSQATMSQVASGTPLPTKDSTTGAEDWENDGQLGVAWQMTGIVSGTRNTVQRDWTEWFTDSSWLIAPAEDWPSDLVVGARFDSEEQVLDPASGLLTQLSSPDAGALHKVTLRFLGRDDSDARARAVIGATEDATCLAIQAALPAASSL